MTRRRLRSRWMQIIPHIAAVLVMTLAAGLLSAMPANAVPRWNPAKAREQRSVPGHASGYRSRPAATGGKPKPAPAVSWPKSGTAEVRVPPSGSAPAGGLPVRLGPPPGKKKSASAGDTASGDVQLRLLDQAAARRAGVDGLLLTVATAGTASQPATASPAPAGSARTEARAAVSGRRGRALMEVDYSKFRYAVGGDWASRLRLVRLPACALTSPERTECRTQTPLASTNDVAAGKVTAQVVVPAAQGTSGESGVVALAAGASGSAGSFAATPLAPSSTWQVSAQTGNFSWSYPLRMPPSLGGPVPQIGLGYSSSAVDGQTASTNNQPSWIGTGFDYWPGYIERRYRSCGDDSGLSPKKQDLCWRYDNATMSLNGNSTELIRDDATGVWKPKDDDGSKVEKLTGAANGDDGDTADKGEHWRITTLDGTQYYFGLNHLPGWSSGKAETGSTWTVPVFGNDDKEPCHKTGTDAADTFDKSWCQQAWRWNLDYVVDPHGNTMTYWYTPETNYYGRNLKSTGVQYTRGGTLTRIDYGQRKDALFTSKAPSQVTFATAERCFPTGSITCSDAQFTTANAKYWPDVPVDQNCKSGDSCANKNSPTFWTRKRLTGVTTQIWNGTKYDPVDTWTLRQEMKDPGDGTSAALWLDGITHAGKINGDAALPEVTFEGTKLSNRVDPLQGPQMIKFRISSITSESGGVTSVNYMPAECTQSNLPAAEDKNDKRCFPLYWTPEGATSQKLEYFQKYPVASVVNDPRVSGTPPVVTAYTYVGAPAWHHDDDDGLVEEKYKTWSQWRGYARVKVTTGRDGDTQSQSETLFYRGMDGDEQKDSNGKPTGRRDASVTDSEGHSVPDADVLEGQVREEIVYDKPGGQIQSATLNTPWVSGATAKRVKSWGTATAAMVRPGTTTVRTLLGDGTWRRTQAVTRYDDHGLGVEAEDDGDLSTSGDDTCTRTTYARNESAGMFNYVSRTLTASVACPAQDAGLPDDKIISGVQNLFDGKDFGAAPSAGNVTETRRLTGFTDGSPDWQTDTKTDYDDYGRVTASYEGGKADHKTTTTYHQVTGGGLVDQTVVTNALGHTETTTYQPAWAARTSVQDANGRTTLQQYDPLGRLTKVWLPGRTSSMSPHMQFTYTISKDKPAVVSTQQLMWDGSTYSTSYQLFDGLLRPVQTQAPAKVDAGGTVTGRMISDAFYDSSGRVFKTNDPYYNETAPSGTLYAPTDNAVPGQTVTTYDGQGRPTVEAFQKLGVEQWHTTTTYTGDSVSVVPPKGSTPTTKIVDAQGRTTELRQYHGATIGGDYDTTRYGYDSAGRLASVTDPAGNVWQTHYDLLGRKTKAEDPDKGTTTYTYTDLDQVESTEDARGKKLYFDYDLLGRQTAEHADSADGPKLAEWIYDKMGSTNVFGQAVSSIRYAGGDPDKAYRTDVTGYDAAYRPTGTRVTIPNADGNGALAGTYETSMTYNADGSMATMTLPAAGGLPKETLRLGYDNLGRPQTLKGASTYVADTGYDGIGNLSTQLMATTTGAKVQRTYTYEDGTNRLKNVVTDRQKASPLQVENTTYDYYDSGDVKSIADQPGNGQSAETQCFTYDYLQRLNDAWTAKDACAAAPSATTVDTMGPAPYWQSYQYDLTGNRTKRTDHDLDGDTSRDVTKTYAYPAAGAKQPHALQSVTTVTPPIPGGSPGGTSVDTFKYDDTGNTTLQTVGGDDQKFDWDAEGHLAASTKGGQTTSFLYDADGDRLIRREPGATTLYLGTMELRLEGSSVTGTRYYTLGDDTVAVRTANGVQFLADDQHGTATRAIDATTNQVTKRYYDPFGAQRGTQPVNWPGERGFLGGTKDDSVGTTHLGAREYDAEDGRFLSVDPVIDSNDPQQMNAYSYGENNPETLSDPDGTRPDICMGGGDPKACNAWGAGQFHRMYPDWKPPHGTPYGDIYYHEGAYSQAAAAARQRAAQVAALKRLWSAQQKKIQLKRKLANALGSLLKIAADELGITAGIDCFAKGDIGACGETALNVLSSFAGGLLGKFAARYGAPWKWAKAAKLIGAVGRLVGTVTKAIKDLLKIGDEVGSAERAVRAACNSFVPETRVRLANGRSKPIDEIKPGDKVLATDPKTGRTRAMPVVATIVGVGQKDLVRVAIGAPKGGKGVESSVVTATAGHPFWSPTAQTWINASDLRVGDTLRTPAGEIIKVTGTRRYTEYRRVNNLTVAHFHTYYVESGAKPVLVHNVGEQKLCDLTLGPALRGQRAEGISAERGDKVLPHEQEFINESGDRNGCAACRARTSGWPDGHWTGDHNPPHKLSENGPWTLYPHCQECSRKQGGIVNGLRREYKSYDFPIVP